MNFELIVRKIYERHNPSKVGDISLLFEKSRGREHELLRRICEKYGVTDDEVEAIVEAENRGSRSKKIVWVSLICSLVVVLIALIVWKKYVDGENLQSNKKPTQVEETNEQLVLQEKPSNYHENLIPNKVALPQNEEVDSSDRRSDYQVGSERAYFFDEPNRATQRKAYLVKGEYITVFGDDFSSEFVYVDFKNARGQISKGWVLRSDLEFLKIE